MKLKIKVLKSDVENGKQASASSCAIARACSRMGFAPRIGGQEANLTCPKTGKRYNGLLPMIARIFIERFDAGASPEPITFECEVNEVE